MTWLSFLGYAFIGILLWTLVEYLAHRFDGHGPHEKGFLAKDHKQHHREVHTFPGPASKYPTAAKFLFAMFLIAWFSEAMLPVMTGSLSFTLGYFYYDWLHRSLHFIEPRTAYGRWARKHHFFHHFHNPRHNHGVTSPIWDILFGTHTWVEKPVRVPRKMAMKWLLSPEGELAQPFVGTYRLSGKA